MGLVIVSAASLQVWGSVSSAWPTSRWPVVAGGVGGVGAEVIVAVRAVEQRQHRGAHERHREGSERHEREMHGGQDELAAAQRRSLRGHRAPQPDDRAARQECGEDRPPGASR
ncbi:hypothetical protein A6035_12910 [Dietzia lutea]|uniref:Uncharacterized protein n=1 Tax=Dietzia lutea TaxID=546160 RepID=A0A2S1R9K9_9ACTN|nr:hypothetical protein A6035_12910 [Dietzia lutea]